MDDVGEFDSIANGDSGLESKKADAARSASKSCSVVISIDSPRPGERVLSSRPICITPKGGEGDCCAFVGMFDNVTLDEELLRKLVVEDDVTDKGIVARDVRRPTEWVMGIAEEDLMLI